MKSEDFAQWLQGFVELNEGKMPTEKQWASICQHLQTVFHKVTPTITSTQATGVASLLSWPDSGVRIC